MIGLGSLTAPYSPKLLITHNTFVFMTKNIEICKAEEVGAQVLDIFGTTAERQTVAAINAAFGLAIPLPANEPGEITELPAAVSAHDRQLLAQTLGKPEPAATLSTTDPLATFVATLTRELYRHFAERTADYLPADFPDPFARNLAHLLQAVQSLSPRKISNGGAPSDGIPDGISLAHLLLSADASAVTILKDDNPAWVYNRDNFIQTLCSIFPNMTRLEMNCSALNGYFWRLDTVAQDKALDIVVRDCKSIHLNQANQSLFWSSYGSVGFPNIRLWIYGLEDGANVVNCTRGMVCGEFYLPDFNKGTFQIGGGASYTLGAALHKVYVSCKGKGTGSVTIAVQSNSTVTDFEVEEGANRSINIGGFNGLTLDNILNHIALRLTDNGSGLTLTLSQAVYTAVIEGSSEICTQIKSIISDKHWKVTDGTNIYPQ